MDAVNSGRLVIDSGSARERMWTNSVKSKYIEALMIGLPTGAITICQFPTDRLRHTVIDGNQRISTVLEFYGRSAGPNDNFVLEKLQFLDDLESKNRLDIGTALTVDRDVLLGIQSQLIQVNRISGIRNDSESEDLLRIIRQGLNFPMTYRKIKDRYGLMFPVDFFTFL
jgi:hypothetical protein